MNQQLEVFFPGERLTVEAFPVDARQLHCALQVVTPFKDWVRRRIKEYGFKESLDFQMRKKELASNLDISVKTPKDYAFSIQAAKELAMIERTPKGREIRAYFLECEKKALIDIPMGELFHGRNALAGLQRVNEHLSEGHLGVAYLLPTPVSLASRWRSQLRARESGGPLC